MHTGSAATLQAETDFPTSFPRPRWRPIPEMSTAQIADEFGDCDLKCRQADAFEKRKKALAAAIAESCSAVADDQTAELRGARWTITVGAKTNETEILDKKKASRAMGSTAFWDACKIGLAALKAAVGEARYAVLTKTERTGYRKMEAVPTVQGPSSESLEKAA
jgi:hypothetical protein